MLYSLEAMQTPVMTTYRFEMWKIPEERGAKMTVVLLNKETKEEVRREVEATSKTGAALIVKQQLGKDIKKYELIGVMP